MSRIHARGLPDFDRRATVFCSIGALPEVVENRKTGWLYPSGDHEQSDRGLVTLLCSPELSSAVTNAARPKILNVYIGRQPQPGH